MDLRFYEKVEEVRRELDCASLYTTTTKYGDAEVVEFYYKWRQVACVSLSPENDIHKSGDCYSGLNCDLNHLMHRTTPRQKLATLIKMIDKIEEMRHHRPKEEVDEDRTI